MNIIRDSIGMQDGIMAISPVEEAICKANHIPTMKGKLYEVDDFGNLMFKKSNTVVLGGSINALEKIFGKFAAYRPKSLNMTKSLFPPTSLVPTYDEAYEKTLESTSQICLFGVGTGGCAMDISNVYTPDFKATNVPGMIPFRVSPTNSLDVAGVLPGADNKTERDRYHFRLPITTETSNMYGWYLKEFQSAPTIHSLWKNAPDLTKDGTEILSDQDVATGPEGVGIESFGEIVIRLDPNDIKPYFDAIGSVETPRYNTIGLFTGSKMKLTDDYSEFYNVRLFSTVNFENVSVRLARDTTYVYRVYSSI